MDRMRRLLGRYLDGTATEEERLEVEKWYEELESMNGYPRFSRQEQELFDAEDLSGIKQKIRFRRSRVVMWSSLSGIAAAIALLIVFFPFAINKTLPVLDLSPELDAVVKFENNSNQPRVVVLEDSSEIILQPNAVLIQQGNFNSSDRRVSLNGEAFFDIEHDPARPFFVHTGEIVTRVLGTSFWVRENDRENTVLVSVESGRVSVFEEGAEMEGISDSALILTPNLEATYDIDKKVFSKAVVPEPKSLPSVRTGEVVRFSNEPVINILAAMEKRYGIKIVLDHQKFESCSVTTSIGGDSYFNQLQSICEVIDASYHLEGDVVHVTGSGCGN